MLRIFKSHLYSAERKKTNLKPFVFQVIQNDLAVSSALFRGWEQTGLMGLEPIGCNEWTVLRLEMGTALARVGIILGIGSPHAWHAFLVFPLHRWTVSESRHEGLHHHFWMQYGRRWKKQPGHDGHKVETVPVQTSFCYVQSGARWGCLSTHNLPSCPVRIHPGEGTFLTLTGAGLSNTHIKLQQLFAT